MSPPPTATKVSLTPGKTTRSDKSLSTVRIMLVPLQSRFKTKIDNAANTVSWDTTTAAICGQFVREHTHGQVYL